MRKPPVAVVSASEKQKFMGKQEPDNISGKIVIVVDDGMATGNTLIDT